MLLTVTRATRGAAPLMSLHVTQGKPHEAILCPAISSVFPQSVLVDGAQVLPSCFSVLSYGPTQSPRSLFNAAAASASDGPSGPTDANRTTQVSPLARLFQGPCNSLPHAFNAFPDNQPFSRDASLVGGCCSGLLHPPHSLWHVMTEASLVDAIGDPWLEVDPILMRWKPRKSYKKRTMGLPSTKARRRWAAGRR